MKLMINVKSPMRYYERKIYLCI